MCLSYLHIPFYEFWDYTPIEIDYALKAYYQAKSDDDAADWERTRTSIYFSYLFVPSKRTKVTYETFRRDYLPFSTDVHEPEVVINDEQFSDIQDYFKNLTGANKN